MLLSVFAQQARKFLLLDKELKRKIVLQQSLYTIPGFFTVLKIPVIQSSQGHTKQLYLCHGHSLHESYNEIWHDHV